MELAFVIDAVRRYFWVVAACTVVGALLAAASQLGSSQLFQSRAVLLLVPSAADTAVRVNISEGNERYVNGQLAVLGSAGLAERVVRQLDDGSTAAEVADTISLQHVPDTDVVHVVVQSPTPERSQEIARAYVDQYFDLLHSQIDGVNAPEIERLEAQLTGIRERLAEVDREIAAALVPFLNAGSSTPVPTAEQVAPGLSSEKSILLSDLAQLRTAQTTLEVSAALRVASEVVQDATSAGQAPSTSSKILLAVGVLGGAFLGVVGAVVLARLSPRVLGIRHAAEILEQSVIGAFPRDRTLAADRLAALRDLPPAVMPFVDLVCVRAEASARAGECLVVVVTGTERRAGCTTLAAAMANRYASHGSRVLLIDADARDPELTRLLAPNAPGILRLLELAPAGPNIRAHADGAMAECFRRTNIPNLQVLGFGDRSRVPMLRRQSVATLLDVAKGFADVVVVDCGALMDAASSVQFATVADAVVLAVPNRQRTGTLEVVARQLRDRRGGLLPVWVPAGRRSRSGGAVDSDVDAATSDSDTPATATPGLSEAIQRARAHVEAQDDPGLARSGTGIRFQRSPRHER